MAKLQEVVKPNGTKTYSINIPLDVVELMGFKKGDTFSIFPVPGNPSDIMMRKVF